MLKLRGAIIFTLILLQQFAAARVTLLALTRQEAELVRQGLTLVKEGIPPGMETDELRENLINIEKKITKGDRHIILDDGPAEYFLLKPQPKPYTINDKLIDFYGTMWTEMRKFFTINKQE